MPIEPVKIPQNVYIEDRIVGPVTLRQIILLLLGGGTSYVLWTMLQRAGFTDIITTIFSWSPLAISAAFAFVKINETNLLRFCFLMYEKSQKPQLRYWQPRTGIVLNAEKLVERTVIKEEEKKEKKTIENINEWSTLLDSGPLPVKDAQPVDTISGAANTPQAIPNALVRDIMPPTPHHG